MQELREARIQRAVRGHHRPNNPFSKSADNVPTPTVQELREARERAEYFRSQRAVKEAERKEMEAQLSEARALNKALESQVCLCWLACPSGVMPALPPRPLPPLRG